MARFRTIASYTDEDAQPPPKSGARLASAADRETHEAELHPETPADDQEADAVPVARIPAVQARYRPLVSTRA